MTNLHEDKIPFASIDEIKLLSINLKKNLTNENIDIKQSLILETIAKSLNFKDFNTLSAYFKDKKQTTFDNTSWPSSKEQVYCHIDNGGYYLSANIEENKIYISSSFFSYGINQYVFQISPDLAKQTLKNLKEKLPLNRSEPYPPYPMLDYHDNHTSIKFSNECLLEINLSNQYSTVCMPLYYNNIYDTFTQILENISNSNLYDATIKKKTKPLI